MIATQPPLMVIDLRRQVTFADSQGLAALVAIHRRAGCLGVTMRTVGPESASPAKVLATCLDGWLPFSGSLTEALQIEPSLDGSG